ncbi:unnamed protein product [Phyllotreta striolata]|uniref:Asparagine synthetase [glutamine-hydrolyzing] n=1 Tax=Phyllotreta striolata TaxID=444603 RepID=A0A9N9TWD5_PHYSR|nr:unnamed protein product [Phyllotreta striolata]
MCGIALIICNLPFNDKYLLKILNLLQETISRRGPDYLEIVKLSTQNEMNLCFLSSVLWLQGNSLSKQPVQNEQSVFIYNGDIFNGISEEFRKKYGDTNCVFEILNESDDIHHSLLKLQGPYAFVYYDKLHNKLHFGRDKYGRRSLLVGKNGETIVLSSVAKRTEDFEFMELPSIGTFTWDLNKGNLELSPFNESYSTKLGELELFLNKSFLIKHTAYPPDINFINPPATQLDLLNNLHGLPTDEAFSTLLAHSEWLENVKQLLELLEDSIKRRISNQPKFCKACIHVKPSCTHSSVGILFSGGVDCSILALLANNYVDKEQPIDLFNVSFDEAHGFSSPDRLTGLQTLEELQELCPNRNWRFIEINIPKSELKDIRSNRIADLIYPLETVIDDDLGCALWFASRGLHDSNCRVLLVGMGADELFGGYTKHRAAFKRDSWSGLHDKLNEDWQNLPYRNLARDDRVVADHGRQLRTPYLDENVVHFVRNLQCWAKSFPSDKVPQGFGDKLLLRSVAYRLGLKKAATLKKRALQFGSRIADSKKSANEVSTTLHS